MFTKSGEDAVCYSQKKITLESILDRVQHLTDPQYQLQLDPFVRERCVRPIQKMLILWRINMADSTETNCEIPEEKIKAIALLSGGLDSAVATKMMQEQGIELIALNFHSPFCTCASNTKFNGCSAVLFAQRMNIPISF